MVTRVPLVVYLEGERTVVGEASVHADGGIGVRFTDHALADRLDFTSPLSISLGPTAEEFAANEIERLRKRTAVVYKRKKR